MKRNLSLWVGVLAFALTPVFGQQSSTPMGKIHGTVTNPVGTPETAGTVSLSTDEGHTSKYTFQVDKDGNYHGEAAPGTYMAIFREPNTPQDKVIDSFENVKIVAGQDVTQDFDMTRQAYIDKLPEDTRKQLAELRKHNSEALKENQVIKQLNEDLKKVSADFHAADGAREAAVQQLGASATKAAVAAKEADIKKEQYTDVETMMSRDTQERPDQSVLWAYLGQAQAGLSEYDPAEASFKKALDTEATAKKPRPEVVAMSHAGLGEIYARTGKVAQANTEYEAAGKADPTRAGFYLKNEAIIFFQAGNGDAQVAAADQAIQADPNDALLYYLKGQGLVQKATFDSKTQKIVLPPGCQEAYEKYLELAPDGPFANDVKGILQQAGQKVENSYKAKRR
jgi:tetratricopeptide (TPR) repeat protein